MNTTSASVKGKGRLAENITHFIRALRVAGLPLGPGAVIEAVQAVDAAGISSREDFYWTLHAVCVKKHEQSLLFHQAFQIYWKKRALMEKLLSMLMPVAPTRAERKTDPASRRIEEAFFQRGEGKPLDKPQVEVDARQTSSEEEVLRQKDFAQMSAAEISAARRRIANLVLPLNAVPIRRFRPDPRGRIIDLRATLRALIRAGGEMTSLKKRSQQERHPPLVVLTDISGSMSQYSRVLLHFVHALMEVRPRVHAFTFGTRLTNITRMLRTKDADEALAACSGSVQDWEGGTRIAPSLDAFNRNWSRRVLSGGAVVLLVTDGLERDGTEDLDRAMALLHRSCRRLIWLNPLLRFDGFEAKARGIRVMLPHVDEFRTIHNLNAVADLVSALDAKRSSREADPRRFAA